MAIRNRHRKGDWLAIDDYTGFTCYGSQLKRDEYGFLTKDPDVVNQQKYIRSYGDPYPVPFVRPDAVVSASNYPTLFIGTTNVPVNRQSPGFQALSQVVGNVPGQQGEILDQEIGESLIIY